MDEMKYDMCGAAAMIASIATAAAMKLPVNIVAAVGFTENMPGSSATKPGDILKSYAGKTVEVLNTDAEGRLVSAMFSPIPSISSNRSALWTQPL